MSMTKQQQVFICGKHRFKTTVIMRYHLHIIDDHDTEHGFWQEVDHIEFGPFSLSILLRNKPFSI